MEPSFVATRPHPRGMWKHLECQHGPCTSHCMKSCPCHLGRENGGWGKTEGYGHLRFGRFTKAGADSSDFTTLHSSENPRSSYLHYTLHVHVFPYDLHISAQTPESGLVFTALHHLALSPYEHLVPAPHTIVPCPPRVRPWPQQTPACPTLCCAPWPVGLVVFFFCRPGG